MPNTSSDSDGVTNLMILQHMQSMGLGLKQEVKELGKRITHLENRTDGLTNAVKEGFAESNRRIKSLDDALQRLFTHRVSMLGRIEKLEEVVGIAQ